MDVSSAVRIDGDLATVTFDRFDLDSYGLFIRAKRLPESQVAFDWRADAYTLTTPARFAPMLGVVKVGAERGRLPIADHLFDYQQWAVGLALDAKRFALWADTGLGKGPMALEWARQVMATTGGRVLYLMPLAVIPQIRAEAQRFYGDTLRTVALSTRDELAEWCTSGDQAELAFCNYEKFIPGVLPELRHIAGLVADESSLLKTGGGTIKWNLIKSARGIEYKLSCTATPAPNEAMEYASQAAFLEKLRSEGDILWTYFSRDKHGVWSIKPHAKAAFYRFMASWSLYVRDPKAFGFADILASLPDPIIREEVLPLTDDQRTRMTAILAEQGVGMFGDRLGVRERAKLAQLARGFVYVGTGKAQRVERVDALKPARVSCLAASESAQYGPTLIWTTFDAEGAIVADELRRGGVESAELTGSMSDDARADVLARFRSGDVHILISKPQLIGYGLNLQFVKAMVFSGFDDSFERMYQAIRRAYRFGQTDAVRVYVPYVPELEGLVFTNLRRKEQRFMEEVSVQEGHYRTALEGMAA